MDDLRSAPEQLPTPPWRRYLKLLPVVRFFARAKQAGALDAIADPGTGDIFTDLFAAPTALPKMTPGPTRAQIDEELAALKKQQSSNPG